MTTTRTAGRAARRRTALAVGVALAMALGACSGDTGSDDDAAAATDDDGSDEGVPPSPMEVALGLEGLQQQFEDVDDTAFEVAYQEAVRDCMVDRGFEYEPWVSAPGADGSFEYTDDPVDSAREYGFGIASSIDTGGGSGEDQDPNAAYVASLDEATRAAYDEALWGESVADTDIGDEEELAEELADEQIAEADAAYRSSCSGQAEEVAFEGEPELPFDPESAVFTELIERYEAHAQASGFDAEFDQLMTDFGPCMADRGHDRADDESAATDLVLRRAEELLGFDPWEVEEQPEDVDPAAVAELKEFETTVAVDAAECMAPITEQQEELYREMEQTFIDEHPDLIARARAEVEA